MCLGIPGRIVAVTEEDGVRFGTVDYGGVRKRACLDHVPEAAIDDYVLVHVGFALTRLDEEEARRLLAFLEELGEAEP